MDLKPENTIYRNILTAFLILIMHVLLLGSIGILVLFFYGIINHMVWIVVGISFLSLGGFWLYRRIKSDSRVLKNVTAESLRGKTVEVSFLGGVANFRISDGSPQRKIGPSSSKKPLQLTSQESDKVSSLKELASMYEKNLITIDEYNKAKNSLFK